MCKYANDMHKCLHKNQNANICNNKYVNTSTKPSKVCDPHFEGIQMYAIFYYKDAYVDPSLKETHKEARGRHLARMRGYIHRLRVGVSGVCVNMHSETVTARVQGSPLTFQIQNVKLRVKRKDALENATS